MASYNRRAEGRRVPYRGGSDRQRATVFGEVREKESFAAQEGRSHRKSRDLLRQLGGSDVRSLDRQNWS